MSREKNTFLTGFAAVMALGCAGLGFLVWQSWSRHSELNEEYTRQLGEYQRLRRAPLYPDADNLAKMEEQKADVELSIKGIREKMGVQELPLEPITPEQFQDRLRVSVSAFQEKAAAANVELPEKFYFGFDQYRTAPPKTEAAAGLGRELKAIELVLGSLVDGKVNKITKIERTPLPEEGDAPKVAPEAKGNNKNAAAKAPIIAKFPFTVTITSDQAPLRSSMNAIANNGKQFFIIRPLSILNENGKPLPKVDPNAVDPQQASDTAGEPDARPAEKLQYIVGTEKLVTTLRFEMVTFTGATPQ